MFLEHLDVSGNALRALPSLSGCKALARLDCASNKLRSLPVSLSACLELRELCCNNNRDLEWLPTDLGLFQPELTLFRVLLVKNVWPDILRVLDSLNVAPHASRSMIKKHDFQGAFKRLKALRYAIVSVGLFCYTTGLVCRMVKSLLPYNRSLLPYG